MKNLKIGMKVKAKRINILRYPGTDIVRKLWEPGDAGYLSGMVTYKHGGPVSLLVTMHGNKDWEELSIADFWRYFSASR